MKEDTFPDGAKGWSWGGFLLNWIWAIGNKTWIGLLAFVPYIGLIVSIYLGIKGRELAWKNKKWDSLEHFNNKNAPEKSGANIPALIIQCIKNIGRHASTCATVYNTNTPKEVLNSPTCCCRKINI